VRTGEAVDMRKHLRRWLNNTALEQMGGCYEGVIATVLEEQVRNRYTAQREQQPVVAFDDGWRLIPNLSIRTAMIEAFGPETEDWPGRRMKVFLRRDRHTNKTTGEMRDRLVKAVMFPDVHERVPIGKSPTSDDGAGDDGPIADYDDSDRALRGRQAR
jgi:hypothetical protein